MAINNVVYKTQRIEVNPANGKISIASSGPQGPIGYPGALSGGIQLPTGGANGQTIVKNSSADGDVSWKTRRAIDIPFVPTGTISADNVQTAIEEVVSDEWIYQQMEVNEVVGSYVPLGSVTTFSTTWVALPVGNTSAITFSHKKMLASSVIMVTLHVAFLVNPAGAYDIGIAYNTPSQVVAPMIRGFANVANVHAGRSGVVSISGSSVGIQTFIPMVKVDSASVGFIMDLNDTVSIHIREVRTS